MRDFVTGTSVVAFKYSEGIVMAADTRGSYGRLAKFGGIRRVFGMDNRTLAGVSGEISDMQHLMRELELLTERESRGMDPRSYHRVIQRILYSARSRLEPLNLSVCVGGVGSGSGEGVDREGRMLGVVDMRGNFFFSDVVCTGIGAHLVLPTLRSKVEDRVDAISREEAVCIIEDAMRILCYRDCNASNEIIVAYADNNGVTMSEPYRVDTNWSIGHHEGEIVIEE